MSLQVCYCGWSKVTTYQGLRTHQGMMGCTPKGARVAENDQYFMWTNVELKNTQKDFKVDVYSHFKTGTTDFYSDMTVQVCHCGWTKMTTYQGLRIHQGRMGCTLKGMRVPRQEQCDWKTQLKMEVKVEVDQRRHQSAERAIIKEENLPELPYVYTNSAATAAANSKGYKSTSATSQRSSQRATKSKSNRQRQDSTLPQVNRLASGPPITPPPVAAVRPKEKKNKHRTSSQFADSGAMKENQRRTYSFADYATTAVINKEKPKSPPQPPFQRAIQSSHQPQDFSIYPQTSDSGAMRRSRSIKSRTDSAGTAWTIKEEPRSPPAPPQYSPLRATYPNQLHDFSAVLQPIPPPPVMSSIDSATTATVKEEPKSPFVVPRPSFQRATYPKSGNQLQDFSAGVQANGLAREHPPTPRPATVASPKEKDRKQNEGQKRLILELQQEIQKTEEKMRPAERDCKNTPDSISTCTQTNPAAAEATTKEDPKSFCETAQPDFPTGLKVKELARMFSAATTQETAVGSKAKHGEKQTQSKLLAQKFSATTVQETEARPKEKDTEDQNLSQNVPDSISAAQANSAAAEATTKEDPKSLGETAQPDFSTGMKVKDLARMFSATTTQETAVRPKEEHREKRKLSQKVPDSTGVTTKMNPAAAEATTEADPKQPCETAPLSDFSTGMTVKELARMFSAATAQETAVRPKEKHTEKRKLA